MRAGVSSPWLGARSGEKQHGTPVAVTLLHLQLRRSLDIPRLATTAGLGQLRPRQQRQSQGLPAAPSEASRPTYHAGEELPVIVAGHPSGAVELEPAVFAGPHAQQARVHLWQMRGTAVSPRGPKGDRSTVKARTSPTVKKPVSLQAQRLPPKYHGRFWGEKCGIHTPGNSRNTTSAPT